MSTLFTVRIQPNSTFYSFREMNHNNGRVEHDDRSSSRAEKSEKIVSKKHLTTGLHSQSENENVGGISNPLCEGEEEVVWKLYVCSG